MFLPAVRKINNDFDLVFKCVTHTVSHQQIKGPTCMEIFAMQYLTLLRVNSYRTVWFPKEDSRNKKEKPCCKGEGDCQEIIQTLLYKGPTCMEIFAMQYLTLLRVNSYRMASKGRLTKQKRKTLLQRRRGLPRNHSNTIVQGTYMYIIV
jgi:hypothetical protein